ncbi:MAG: hypothetical protein KKF50_00675 [Nanoarchaeota archaeon]|nr:hypothetical protein [Nanoarchaeota archaeon]
MKRKEKKDPIHRQLNAHYKLKLRTEQLEELRAQAKKEGISLAEHLRVILSQKVKLENILELYLKDILQKLDQILKRS